MNMLRLLAIVWALAMDVTDVWAINCDGVFIGGEFAPVDLCTAAVDQNAGGQYVASSQKATCSEDGTMANWTVWGSPDCTGFANVSNVTALGGTANCGTGNECAFYLELTFFYDIADPVVSDCTTYEPRTDELFGTNTVLLNECITVAVASGAEARKYSCDVNTYVGVKYDVYADVAACEAGGVATETQSVALETCTADGGDGVPVKQSIIQTTCTPADYAIDCDVILMPDTFAMHSVGVCGTTWGDNGDGTYTPGSQKRECSADGTTVNRILYSDLECQTQVFSSPDYYMTQGGIAICGSGSVCPTAFAAVWHLDDSVTYTEAELCASFVIETDDRYRESPSIIERCLPYGSAAQSWIQYCNADGTVNYAIYESREECLAGDTSTVTYSSENGDSWSQCHITPFLTKEKLLCPTVEVQPSYVPTTATPTSAAPTTAEPTTATPTAPTTASPTNVTTEVTTRSTTESETTDSNSNHTVTFIIRSDSLSSTQILIAIASAHNLSSTPLIFTTLSSDGDNGGDGFATVELLVAVPSNVELDYDVIKATLKEAMVDEYGEDVQVDIDVDDKDESDEYPPAQPAGTTKLFGLHWLVIVALCIASVCCCGAVVVAIRCVMGKLRLQPQRDDVDDRQHAHAQQIVMTSTTDIHAIDSQSDIHVQPDLPSTHESSMSNRSEGLRASVVVAASTAGLVDEHHVQPIQTQGLEEDEFEVVDDDDAVTAGHTRE